ncbi:MAG TPA: cell wall-binding repeat-containing protein, partial [Coriobacteriia bacterium]
PPWWLTPPLVIVRPDQDGVVHWAWDAAAESTMAVTGGLETILGPAPEGTRHLSAYTVNSLGETETPGIALIASTDSRVPSQPGALTVTEESGVGIRLRWTDSVDPSPGSGLAAYRVFRRSTAPPFEVSDVIATLGSATLEYLDTPPSSSDPYYYAVSTVDVAGNESALSDFWPAFSDLTGPTMPGNLAAWRNASGVVHVSWTASTDVGRGVAAYEVWRRLDAGVSVLVAVVGAPATYFDDGDPAVGSAASVEYRVIAVDHVGLKSAPAGPVTLGTDVIPPTTPSNVGVIPEYAPPEGGSYFDVWWGAPTDAGGSGLDHVELLYGPDRSAPSMSLTRASSGAVRVNTTDDSAGWWFQVVAVDKAGNRSAPAGPYAARNVTVARVSGADRVAVGVNVSKATWESAPTVVVASAYVYPDALAASALAGEVRGPILLVGPGGIRADVLGELKRLGARDAYVVGGPGTVSAATFESLKRAVPGTVTRLWGPDRYTTAAKVATELRRLHGPSDRAYVVSGRNFPDALSVGPAAFAGHAPVLFATGTSVPPVTVKAVAASGAQQTVIVGGTGSVTPKAERLLPAPVRIGGADRYVVSRAFADWAISAGVLTSRRPVMASGIVFPDGLSSAPLAGRARSVTLLTANWKYTDAASWLAGRRRIDLQKVTIAGGPGTLAEGVRFGTWKTVSVP